MEEQSIGSSNAPRSVSNSDPNWNVISLRYFNPVGAHESVIGEDPLGIG